MLEIEFVAMELNQYSINKKRSLIDPFIKIDIKKEHILSNNKDKRISLK